MTRKRFSQTSARRRPRQPEAPVFSASETLAAMMRYGAEFRMVDGQLRARNLARVPHELMQLFAALNPLEVRAAVSSNSISGLTWPDEPIKGAA